jgi:hypothetical protein
VPVADWIPAAPPAQTTDPRVPRRELVVNAQPVDDPAGERIVAVFAPAAWAVWSRGPTEYVPAASGVVARGTADPAFTDVIDNSLLMVAFAGDRVTVSSALAISDELAAGARRRWTPRPTSFAALLRALGTTGRAASPMSSAATEGAASTLAGGDVRALAGEVKRLSGLTDAQLAALFPGEVARETFNRWRNRSEPRPTASNVRRLELLRRLYADLGERPVPSRTWLLTPLAGGDQSPYDLLAAGRLSDVEELVAMLPREGDEAGGEATRLVARRAILTPDEPHATPDLGMEGDEEGWVEVEIGVDDAE